MFGRSPGYLSSEALTFGKAFVERRFLMRVWRCQTLFDSCFSEDSLRAFFGELFTVVGLDSLHLLYCFVLDKFLNTAIFRRLAFWFSGNILMLSYTYVFRKFTS